MQPRVLDDANILLIQFRPHPGDVLDEPVAWVVLVGHQFDREIGQFANLKFPLGVAFSPGRIAGTGPRKELAVGKRCGDGNAGDWISFGIDHDAAQSLAQRRRLTSGSSSNGCLSGGLDREVAPVIQIGPVVISHLFRVHDLKANSLARFHAAKSIAPFGVGSNFASRKHSIGIGEGAPATSKWLIGKRFADCMTQLHEHACARLAIVQHPARYDDAAFLEADIQVFSQRLRHRRFRIRFNLGNGRSLGRLND